MLTQTTVTKTIGTTIAARSLLSKWLPALLLAEVMAAAGAVVVCCARFCSVTNMSIS